jgi:molybdenum cofactor biosynthesis protein B
MKTHEKHRKDSSQNVRVSIFTVSSSKFQEANFGRDPNDLSGEKIKKMVENVKYKIVSSKILDDNIQMIRVNVLKSIYEDKSDAILITGGTGISSRDITIESVRPLFNKELYGFGEIFRYLSYKSIGSAAHLSRAVAGVINDCIVYCLPGSPDAVDTALEIVIPELPHVIHMLKS